VVENCVELVCKRRAEGIAKTKAKVVYKGGKKMIYRDQVHQLKEEGLSTYKIAESMGISRMSVHRILNG
jgi:DNA invertase Pin-like site-specific DNA recombinase